MVFLQSAPFAKIVEKKSSTTPFWSLIPIVIKNIEDCFMPMLLTYLHKNDSGNILLSPFSHCVDANTLWFGGQMITKTCNHLTKAYSCLSI